MRIAVAGLHTECSTYNPVLMGVDAFRVLRGDALLAHEQFAMLKDFEVEYVPLIHARAIPGGPVERATYEAFKAEMLDGLAKAGPLDGVYLAMHGAVFVDGMEDAEGDWISAVRDAVGPDVPISVSYDLHGNVSERVIAAIDLFAAYRTAPHIDVSETQSRAMAMLLRCLKTGIRPVVGFAKVPVLLPGERTSTEDEPAKSLYAQLPMLDLLPGIWDANIMVGYVWADEPRATASMVVTGDDAAAVEAVTIRLARAYFEARDEFTFGAQTGTVAECVAWAMEAQEHPVILADSGDNPTGGGVGDRADVLAALLNAVCRDAVVAGIADAPATAECFAAGVGAQLSLSIGATLDSLHSTPIKVDATVLALDEALNRRALVEIEGLRLVLTAKRRPFHNIHDFTSLGIDPAEERLVVVKSGYLSPELAPLAKLSLMALSDGVVNQDIPALRPTKIARPMFPFDREFAFQPKVFIPREVS